MRIEDNYPVARKRGDEGTETHRYSEGDIIPIGAEDYRIVWAEGQPGYALRRLGTGPVMRHAIHLEPGRLYQLGRKALAVEVRDGEPVLVLLAEAPG